MLDGKYYTILSYLKKNVRNFLRSLDFLKSSRYNNIWSKTAYYLNRVSEYWNWRHYSQKHVFIEKYVRLKSKKKVNIVVTIIFGYVWVFLNKQGPDYARVLNMPNIKPQVTLKGT